MTEEASRYAMDRVFNKSDKGTAAEVEAENNPTMTAQWFSFRRHVLDPMASTFKDPADRKAYVENARSDWFGGALSFCILIQEQAPELMKNPFVIGLYQEILDEMHRSPSATKITGELP